MFRWLQRMLFNSTWEEQQNLLLRKPLFPFSCSVLFDSLWPHGLQHTRLLYASPSPGVCSNSCPLSRWCQFPTISSSVLPFSSCLQSFPGLFQRVSSLHQVAKVLGLHLQHQSFQWMFRLPSNRHALLSISEEEIWGWEEAEWRAGPDSSSNGQ